MIVINDGISDVADNCHTIYNANQLDTDGDGMHVTHVSMLLIAVMINRIPMVMVLVMHVTIVLMFLILIN